MDQKEYALIVAGGKGTRIGDSLPKQFIALNGKPLLLHTLEAFDRYSSLITVVLVLPENEIETWKSLAREHRYNKKILLQAGGDTRFQSVKKGLERIEGNGLVAIHDGARPLVSPDIIAASFQLAGTHKTAVASVQLKESLRMIAPTSSPEGGAEYKNKTKAVDRSRYRLIQTPQTFDVQLVKKAYQIEEDPTLTDDASVVERAGHTIALFEGSYDNIKVTTPEDLIVAATLLKKKS